MSNKRKTWLALDSTNGAYAGVIASVTAYTAAHGSTISITDGRWANSKIVECELTEAEFILLGIAPGSGVMLCRFSYSILNNNNAGPAAVTATTYGDNRLTYGVYPKPVTAIPTDGVDRAVAWAKNTGTDTFIFADEAGAGTGDGSSRVNRKSVHSSGGPSDFESYSGVIWIGTLSRFVDQGNGGGGLAAGGAIPAKTGTSGTRTVWLSDVDSTACFMGGAKVGNSVDGADANWTNDGGGRWHIHSTSTAGGGGAFEADAFVLSNAGGTLRALTKVASAAAVTALADSFFISAASGNSDIYVRLADGSDPENTTFIAPYSIPGIGYSPTSNYVDHYGIRFYQQGVYTFDGAGSYTRFYNCYWGYLAAPFFRDRMPEVTEGTGDMSFSACTTGRVWHGCEAEYAPAGFYDASTACNVVPQDTTLLDFYFHNIGIEAADAFGVSIATPGDSHCVAFEGGTIGLTVQNLRCHNVGPETLVLYVRTANFADPAGGPLESTPGFTVGYPVAKCYTMPNLSRQFASPVKDVLIEDFLFTGLVSGGSYAATEGMAVSLNGDGSPYGYAAQFSNIIIRRGRVEMPSAANFSGLRNKLTLNIAGGASNREIEIYDVHIRGAAWGHYIFGNPTDENGATAEASWYVHGCTFHAIQYFGRTINHSETARRLREYRSNTYYTNTINLFDYAAGETGNFAYWQANIYGNDIHDPSPSATALIPVSTGTAAASISGEFVGDTLTAGLGADPDGATSSLTYQWALEGEEIEGETVASLADVEAGTYAVAIVYFAGGNWKVATASVDITEAPADPTPGTIRRKNAAERLAKRKIRDSLEVIEKAAVALTPKATKRAEQEYETVKSEIINLPDLSWANETLKSAERAMEVIRAAQNLEKKRQQYADEEWILMS